MNTALYEQKQKELEDLAPHIWEIEFTPRFIMTELEIEKVKRKRQDLHKRARSIISYLEDMESKRNEL